MTKQHPLLSWFDSVGIQLHPSLRLASDPLTGLSFYTSAPLPSDSVVISVPTRLCITSESAFDRIETLLRHLSGSELELDKTSLPAPDWILVYLVLSRLYQGYSASEADQGLREVFEHQPYVDHIPKIIATPLHFSTAELGLLAKTPLHGSTQRRLDETIVDYGRAQTLIAPHLTGAHPFAAYLSSVLTPIPSQQLESDPSMSSTHFAPLELWRWAELALTSRSFPPRLIHATGTTPVLVPAYDTFNHARAHAVTWSTSPHDTVVLTLHSATPAGAQVYNNYGGKSNEEFLSGYGFTLASAHEDTLALKLPGDKTATHYWRFTADETEHQGESFVKATCPCPSLLDDLQTHLLPSQPTGDQQHELELYASVLETLESLLVGKRKAFRQSQALFEAVSPSARDEEEEAWNRANANLVREQVYANVNQYRKGQLELLNHAVKWTRGELERVVDVLDAEDE